MTMTAHDPHTQLRALYQSLLARQENFDEFKRLLALYDVSGSTDAESTEAAAVRRQLNDRIRQWVGGPFDGLTAAQTLQWRAIVVEERFNVSLSPWKESNAY
jgi:predicted nucleic acid-binding protein